MAKVKAFLANPYVKWAMSALAASAVVSQNPVLAAVGGIVLGAYHVNTPPKAP